VTRGKEEEAAFLKIISSRLVNDMSLDDQILAQPSRSPRASGTILRYYPPVLSSGASASSPRAVLYFVGLFIPRFPSFYSIRSPGLFGTEFHSLFLAANELIYSTALRGAERVATTPFSSSLPAPSLPRITKEMLCHNKKADPLLRVSLLVAPYESS
jgi:hypothetical protein